MKRRVMAVVMGSILLMGSLTVSASPSPSVSTNTEVSSDVLVTTDKTVDEIKEAATVLVEALVETGEVDTDGKLTNLGVAMVTSILETISYTTNGETLETGLVVQKTEDDREVAGLIISLDGELLGTMELGAVVVTNTTAGTVVVEDGVVTKPVVEGLAETAAVQMEQAIAQLFGTEETVAVEEAEVFLREVFSSISNVEVAEDSALSVLNVVDIDLTDFAKTSVQEYSALALITVDLGVTDSQYIAAIHNYEGENWENLPCTNNGDGTVTLAMSTFSPVAFVVSDTPIITEVSVDVEDTTEGEVEDGDVAEDSEEATEDVVAEAESDSSMMMYVGIAVAVVAGIAFFAMKKKKSPETTETK